MFWFFFLQIMQFEVAIEQPKYINQHFQGKMTFKGDPIPKTLLGVFLHSFYIANQESVSRSLQNPFQTKIWKYMCIKQLYEKIVFLGRGECGEIVTCVSRVEPGVSGAVT